MFMAASLLPKRKMVTCYRRLQVKCREDLSDLPRHDREMRRKNPSRTRAKKHKVCAKQPTTPLPPAATRGLAIKVLRNARIKKTVANA
jgi:hypothetical protein